MAASVDAPYSYPAAPDHAAARSKERIVDPNDLHVVAIFLKGVLTGWFADRHGWLRGGTWLFLGLAIAGLVGRVVVGESLLTAMLPIPFFVGRSRLE